MAQAHVYVRVQFTGADADAERIGHAVEALQAAVEAAGGEWIGGAHVMLDAAPAAPEPVAEPEPAPPTE
jgi:hypothetical protein